MAWRLALGVAGLANGAFSAFVSSPQEAKPTVTSHKHVFQYRNETVEATLDLQSPSGLCDPSVKQHSGYFTFGKDKKQYFFWMFESRSDPANDPTVMWLTGGPGCSSMTGLLFENGPCKVAEDGKSTTLNPYSWTTKANVMWIDQPPGTGFSKGKWDFGEEGVAEDMYQFLQVFFKAKPEYNKKFYVTGESYAGHYIPAVTSASLRATLNCRMVKSKSTSRVWASATASQIQVSSTNGTQSTCARAQVTHHPPSTALSNATLSTPPSCHAKLHWRPAIQGCLSWIRLAVE